MNTFQWVSGNNAQWSDGRNSFFDIVQVNDATNAHTLEAPIIEQHQYLIANALSNAHTLEAPSIEQHQYLIANALSNAHTLGSVNLSHFYILTADDLSHSHILDDLTVGEGWFDVVMAEHLSEPRRRFTMAGSDHSERVVTWPTIRRNIERVKAVNVGVTLSNADGLYNGFHESLYTIPASCTLEIGFKNPAGENYAYVQLYTGVVEKVGFQSGGRKVKVFIKDKIYDFSLRKAGSTDDPISMSNEIPSEIAWTLCTCYGGMSDITSTSNADIDYTKFSEWALTFSQDSVVADAYYEGKKIVEGLEDLCQYTDSFAWVDGSGKVVFERFEEVSSLDFLIEDGQTKKFELDIDLANIVNKQYVSYNYSVESDYWVNQISDVDTVSVNSFNVHEEVLEKESIWYTNSLDAHRLSLRRLSRLGSPPREFKADIPLFGLNREPGNTVRIVSSFFGVTSGSGWRIEEQQVKMQNLSVSIKTNEALVANGFYLDVSSLDGDELLL